MPRRLLGAAALLVIAFAGPWTMACLAGLGFGPGMIAVGPQVYVWPVCPVVAVFLFRKAGAVSLILLGLLAFGAAVAGLKWLSPIEGFVSGLAADVSWKLSPEEWRRLAHDVAAKSSPPADPDLLPPMLRSKDLPSAVRSIGPGLHRGWPWFTENGQPGGINAYGGGGHMDWGIKISIKPEGDAPLGLTRKSLPVSG